MINRRLGLMLGGIPALLAIPFVAMQFTKEVQWSAFDFLLMGTLLLAVVLAFEFILRKTKRTAYRLLLGGVVVVTFLLIWAELAVGVFGTYFAGN